ncbi:hypothetical protein [Propionibacterium phage PA1-14]|uniref:hypothetical protein n=1 Tax=Propionibacterium phage PA1-14 TaxID=1747271 RepID=UPI00071F1599|nr:hypothetical protein AU147_gp43 [Propionibacterium phage PA1-14]ALM02146.1 hypothetical protein [Propionibacterium phage PA1-14]
MGLALLIDSRPHTVRLRGMSGLWQVLQIIRKVEVGIQHDSWGALSGHGIYTLILCEMYHILLAWCALSIPLFRSGVEGVAQECRLKPSHGT